MSVLVLNEGEIRRCVSMTDEAAEAVALGFTRLSEGRVSMPPVVRVDIPAHRGEVDIKTAYIEGYDRFAIKVASGFFDNPSRGLPYGSGLMLVMSASTGLLEAVLLDNGYLTDLRTGLAGAIAARHLAPRAIDTAGVIGSGMQARFQLRALAARAGVPAHTRAWTQPGGGRALRRRNGRRAGDGGAGGEERRDGRA